MNMEAKAFLRDLGERVGWTAVQAFLATLGVVLGKQAIDGTLDVTKVAWGPVLSVAAGAAVLSVIKGLVAFKANPATGASTGTTEPLPAAPEPAAPEAAPVESPEPDEDVDDSDVAVAPEPDYPGK